MAVDIEVRDAREQHRYEAVSGDVVAGFIDYRDANGSRTLRHTEVSADFEGKGIGGALARAALDDIRARGLTVRPVCPFVARWLNRHPDYLDVVADAYRDRVRADRS
ncbi:MAG TPA: GNAT family N-acetyltransferase [Actinophytocola sp.]|uniref:GNAT family N-acetyltransferase n=1 Tax=Actinophytocola sp. TaxID=1872138 RepID=UPI002DDDA0C1|nr:GNAT family N-acetyltransferase [Actinophytocola sp.]HEV2781679.1 GNAT family N-acetyltransferase [Actinophytocola sp.]